MTAQQQLLVLLVHVAMHIEPILMDVTVFFVRQSTVQASRLIFQTSQGRFCEVCTTIVCSFLPLLLILLTVLNFLLVINCLMHSLTH